MPKCIVDTEIGQRRFARSDLAGKRNDIATLHVVVMFEVLGTLSAPYVDL